MNRRRVLLGIAVLVVVWVLGAAYLLLRARSDVAAGTHELRQARAQATIAQLLQPGTGDHLSAAQQHFDAAASRLDHPWLWPVRVLPVASRHLAAGRRLAHAAADGSAAADDALTRLRQTVDRPHRRGPERLAVLADLAAVGRRTDRALGAIDVGSGDGLIGPLGRAVRQVDDQRAAGQRGARRLATTALALRRVLAGPEPYLLLGANNAEMRAGGGMYLSAATVGFHQGDLDLGPVRPAADLVLPAGKVTATGDLARNWPWLDPARDLRNLGLTPDFPQNAALAVQTWAAAPGGARTAGVIVIDVDGVRALLRALGPVEVDGVRYTADTVRGELLRNQYRRYRDDRAARRDALGGVAEALFRRMQAGRWQVDQLGTQLVDAVAGRHLLVWSADPAVQRAWRDVGADGHLERRSLSVALLNRSAIKSDSWVDTEAAVTSSTVAGGRTRITLRYRITNHVPATGPAYVVGPNVAGLRAGDHRGLVVVDLPGGTTDLSMTGARRFLQGGDGPAVVVAGDVTVRRGTSATVTVTALLPAGLHEVVLEPAARIQPTRWTVDGTSFDRDRRRTVSLAGS